MALVVQPILRATHSTTGLPLPFALAYFSETGGTTPVAVYEDEDFATPHADPVVADANGEFPTIYADPTLGNLRLRVIPAGGSLASPHWDVELENTSDGLTNSSLAEMPAGTLKGNLTAGPATPNDYTTDEVTDELRYASETEQGVIELATTAEAVAGTDTARAVTPAGLQAFMDSQAATDDSDLSTDGYLSLSNGLILQWGRTALIGIDDYSDIVFPIPFPTACLNVQHSPSITNAYTLRYDSWSLRQAAPTLVGFRVYCASSANANGIYVDWFAIGH